MVMKAVKNEKPSSKLDLNICYIYTKYSYTIKTAPVAEGLVFFLFDSYVPGSCRVERFSMCQLFSRLNVHRIVTEMRLKTAFPVTIHSPFSHH